MNTTQELDARGTTVEASEPQPIAEIPSAETESHSADDVARSETVQRHRRASLGQLLHAFAQAGLPTVPHQVQPLVGPTGAVVWTSLPPSERSWSQRLQDGWR
jgi:hypothetical protein